MISRTLSTFLLLAIPAAAHAGPGAATGTAAGNSGGRGVSVSLFGLRTDSGASPVGGYIPFDYHGSPGFPFYGVWGGFGGDMPASLYYQIYGYPMNPYPQDTYGSLVPDNSMMTGSQRTRTIQTARMLEPQIVLADEYAASLTLQLPAAGFVSANGVKAPSKPDAEWTLTSPMVLKAGQLYNFEVKARWKLDGKEYEYTRTYSIEAGNRSRVTILSGTLVK